MGKKKLTYQGLEEQGLAPDLSGLFGEPSTPAQKQATPDSLNMDQLKKSKKDSKKMDEKHAADDSEQEQKKRWIQSYIEYIPVSDLVEFHKHPYPVLDDARMDLLVDTIRPYGSVIVPLSVQELSNGKYEILSGHRRKRAAEILGLEELPCIIFDVDEKTAVNIVVDSNEHRDLSPSERAAGYKLKYETLKESYEKEGKKDIAFEQLVNDSTMSKRQIIRYLRLNDLNQYLLSLVDENSRISTTAGYHLSYLNEEQQEIVSDVLRNNTKIIVSVKYAEALQKATTKSKEFTADMVQSILTGKLKTRASGVYAPAKKPTFNAKTFNDFYPPQIANTSVEKKISFVQDAIRCYTQYIETHPEEINMEELYAKK